MLHGINRAGGGTLTESWTFGATQPAIVNKNNGKRKSVFDVILRLSEALVCFRASGDNFLRSITRAIVNKNVGKRKIDFLTLF